LGQGPLNCDWQLARALSRLASIGARESEILKALRRRGLITPARFRFRLRSTTLRVQRFKV
jgi:hypothetical protein